MLRKEREPNFPNTSMLSTPTPLLHYITSFQFPNIVGLHNFGHLILCLEIPSLFLGNFSSRLFFSSMTSWVKSFCNLSQCNLIICVWYVCQIIQGVPQEEELHSILFILYPSPFLSTQCLFPILVFGTLIRTQ